jgi:hypothetical protein
MQFIACMSCMSYDSLLATYCHRYVDIVDVHYILYVASLQGKILTNSANAQLAATAAKRLESACASANTLGLTAGNCSSAMLHMLVEVACAAYDPTRSSTPSTNIRGAIYQAITYVCTVSWLNDFRTRPAFVASCAASVRRIACWVAVQRVLKAHLAFLQGSTLCWSLLQHSSAAFLS